ncbi:hypothetical protein H6P81_004234 [Aristolochia fimbriata]|uniref:Uncharacterized protein n=1 Tax=Aristolochia fimbriata TaxID=158543 RepID=A0AAV7FFX1_ARIFI|nr:hypothetical protein H6P81_004234 [Aristolochia fimbriata]
MTSLPFLISLSPSLHTSRNGTTVTGGRALPTELETTTAKDRVVPGGGRDRRMGRRRPRKGRFGSWDANLYPRRGVGRPGFPTGPLPIGDREPPQRRIARRAGERVETDSIIPYPSPLVNPPTTLFGWKP